MPRVPRLKPATPERTLDCRGLLCPLPILEAARALSALRSPFNLSILSDDPAARKDFIAFAKKRKLRLKITLAEGHSLFQLMNRPIAGRKK